MAISSKPPLVLIAGPTASGKSALALALAEQIGGVIVNADATQIYRDLPILSAAPGSEERAKRRASAVRGAGWRPALLGGATGRQMARARDRATCTRRGALPILVGGTGLYLAHLARRDCAGAARSIPRCGAEFARRRSRTIAAQLERTRSRSGGAARSRRTRRGSRARSRSCCRPAGRSREWQTREGGRDRRAGRAEAADPAAAPRLAVRPLRRAFREDGRARRGRGGEGAARRASSTPDLPVMRAIGVAEMSAHLRGEMSLGEAIAAGQQATRRYAKRQYTWFAHQPPADWPRFSDIPVPVRAELVEGLLFLESRK